MKKIVAMFAILLVVGLYCGVAVAADEPKPEAPKADAPKAEAAKPLAVGDTVPDFTYPTVAGTTVSFDKDIKGKKNYAVLVFMTTACSACQAEIEDITDLMRKYSDKLDFYAVSVDIRGEAAVKNYLEAYRYKAPFLIDPKFTLPKKFGFTFTPASVLIDKNGKIVYMLGGRPMSGDVVTMEDKILSLMK